MASLHKEPRTGNWTVMFRWQGKQYSRSCGTNSKIEAQALAVRVGDTIRLAKQGRIEIPDDDPASFIFTDGKQNNYTSRPTPFAEICDQYLVDQHGKADTTIEAEKCHIRHFKNVLGKATLDQLDTTRMQKYANTRLASKYRGKLVSGDTVRKELLTFKQVWSWAKAHGYVKRDCPVYKGAISLPKREAKEKFQTWEQIERRIKRGANEDLWEFVYLDWDQVKELLQHTKEEARHPFIYPMFCFAAYTGARKSEILRSHVEDFDFESGQILIRERKRRKDMASTFRTVGMHDTLRDVMREWIDNHPGGQHTIPVTSSDAAQHHFRKTLEKSKWKVVRGFHVLRHSFGSNYARTGKVTRDTIAAWMGHTSEEMKSLYQHLFPQDWDEQINVLS